MSRATVMGGGVFEGGSVIWHAAGGVQFLFSGSVLLVLAAFSFWGALGAGL